MRRLAFFVLLLVAVELYGETYVQDIRVLKPALLSDVSGRVTVEVQVSRMTSLTARCAGQGIARDVRPHRNGIVRFRLNTRKLPRGPLTVRLSGRNERGECDLYELQLYNTNPRAKDSSGIPDIIPEAATGMTLAFVDDFTDATLSISADGREHAIMLTNLRSVTSADGLSAIRRRATMGLSACVTVISSSKHESRRGVGAARGDWQP